MTNMTYNNQMVYNIAPPIRIMTTDEWEKTGKMPGILHGNIHFTRISHGTMPRIRLIVRGWFGQWQLTLQGWRAATDP